MKATCQDCGVTTDVDDFSAEFCESLRLGHYLTTGHQVEVSDAAPNP